MNIPIEAVITTDVLVIGSGGSGLMAAIEARKTGVDVIVATKGLMRNCTIMSGGGISAALGITNPEDCPKAHFQDTLDAGRYLNDTRLVKIFVVSAPSLIGTLQKMGVPFKSADDRLFQYRGAGHTFARGLQVSDKAVTAGVSLVKPLIWIARSLGVGFCEEMTIIDLVRDSDGVQGAIGLDRKKNRMIVVEAKSTVLCTGGLGQLYSNTNNPPGTIGDGYAMAIRAGARLVDMEFVQFYPFSICEPGLPRWNIGYEQVIDAGGTFVNEKGENLLASQIQESCRTTRDRLAIAVASEIRRSGSVFLDLRNVTEDSWTTPPRIRKIKQRYGPRKKIRVAPIVHYFMGGIRTSEECETDVCNLYAAGEVVGGIHGANRLNGNALSEVLVFGAIAGRKASENAKSKLHQAVGEERMRSLAEEMLSLYEFKAEKKDYGKVKGMIRSVMWDNVGILRNKEGLEQALCLLRCASDESLPMVSIDDVAGMTDAVEIRNMLTVAEIVTGSALKREESRGSHFRSDFPREDENWLGNIEVSLERGQPCFELHPRSIISFDEVVRSKHSKKDCEIQSS